MSGDSATPGITNTDHQPISRDDYAAHLHERLATFDPDTARPGATLNEAEGRVAAELLDVLAAAYPGEDLGRLARAMAVRLYDKLGI
ncbi:hypothetical protein LO763_19595 [Glycomyces sp. A-F 0318]|uniref:hypothetical protein n=1 Tax=Glycomyces amatae TaxID=2881355 RepID=UPI001E2F982A|nr:hypothetical protein [Glycomyces amatae]MCD0445816.1 hypothetical protein [Glycomyces amatae]